jgi:thioredoxin-related protein
MKPVVDGLEQELGTKIEILRVNIQSQAGRDLAPHYDFEYTPTFIMFDAKGNELWRSIGTLDVQKVRDAAGG